MPDFGVLGILQRTVSALPGAVPNTRPRLNQLGDQISANVHNGMQQAAVEDSYFTYNSSGTRGTGVAIGSATGTTYSATNALLIVDNVNAPGGPDVIMDYISIMVDTIAGGAPTFWHWYHALDKAPRYSSGAGVATLLNASGASPSGVNVYGGLLVAAAATAGAHDVDHTLMQNGASVANAKVLLKYAGQESPGGVVTTPTTAVGQATIYAAPVVIHPGYSYVVNEFWVGRTTSSLVGELLAGMIIR